MINQPLLNQQDQNITTQYLNDFIQDGGVDSDKISQLIVDLTDSEFDFNQTSDVEFEQFLEALHRRLSTIRQSKYQRGTPDHCQNLTDITSAIQFAQIIIRPDFQKRYSQLKASGVDLSTIQKQEYDLFKELIAKFSFIEKEQLARLPVVVDALSILGPNVVHDLFVAADGSATLKDEFDRDIGPSHEAFAKMISKCFQFSDVVDNLSFPNITPQIRQLIIENTQLKYQPFDQYYLNNNYSYNLRNIDEFIAKLSEKDAMLTKQLCASLLAVFPNITAQAKEQLLTEQAQENAAFADNALKTTVTLGFQRYRENQPLSSVINQKAHIIEGRQRLETALTSLMKKGYLPMHLDAQHRKQVVKAMKHLNSERFSPSDIKAHLKDSLKLTKRELSH